MTYETVLKYTEESVKQCRELASFLKKRQAAEAEYARSLLKITQRAPPIANLSPSFYRSPSSSTANVAILNSDKSDNNVRSQLLKTSLWKSYCEVVEETQKLAESHNEMAHSLQHNVLDPFQNYIREMEAIRKMQLEKGQEFIKNLQDAYAGLKKVKKEYENLQSVSNEAISTHIKAQHNPSTRDRELEKLTNKMQTAIEKAKRAEETLQICEDICNNAKEDYFGTFLPGLYEDIRTKEEERCIAVKRVLLDFLELEKAQMQGCGVTFEILSERVSDIDISDDSDDFVNTYIYHDDSGSLDIPARNITNPIHSGVIQMKRGDLVGTWKDKYAVLTADKHLYIYASKEANRPSHSIPLKEATVSSVDDSFFGRTNCIQVVQSTNSGRQVYNICTNSESDRDRWLHHLRDFCYCCPKCASVYGFSTETLSNLHLLDRVNGFRLIRSLNLSIMEAKDLPSFSGSRSFSPYCMILFDDVKQAKTTMKLGDNPFWGESFTFDDIRPHHNRRDTDIGYVSIHLDQIKSPKRVEEWFPIRPTSKSSEDMGSCGSIRIAFTFREEHLLPTSQYESFLTLVTEPKYSALKQLGKLVVSDREILGKTVVRVFIGLGREVEGLRNLLEADINATEDPNIIFRGNSLATKGLDQYMKQIAMPYLHATVGNHLRTISSLSESCEVDPLRVENPEKERANIARLSHYAAAIWNSILNSADHCPSARQLCEIFGFIRSCIAEKWGPGGGGENAKYSGVSGFLFLRFFCPAILSPRLFNITNDLPSPASTRTLTLLAKIIQNLANLTEFGNKEPYMVQFNAFIQSQMPAMRRFIDRISTPEAFNQNPAVSDLRIDLRRETEALYQLFSQYLGDIITSSTGGPVDELVNTMKELQVAHRRYDGDERQISEAIRALGGSVANSPRRPNLPIIPSKTAVDTASGPSSPPSSVFASPIVSALPPKIELLLEESNTATQSPPQTLSPAASPIAYRKHREVSIYGRVTNKSTSFENLEQLLNTIATGGDASSVASKLRDGHGFKSDSNHLNPASRRQLSEGSEDYSVRAGKGLDRPALPISVKVQGGQSSVYPDGSPASGATSPKYTDAGYGSPKSAWSSNESLPESIDTPRERAGINHMLGLGGSRPKPPPRASSAVSDKAVAAHVQGRPDGIITSQNGQATYTPSQARGTSLFRSIVSAVGGGGGGVSGSGSSGITNHSSHSSACSSPIDRGSPAASVHSLPSDGSGENDDTGGSILDQPTTSPQYGSVVSGPFNDDDAFSDRSSVKSIESYKSGEISKNPEAGGRLPAFANRRQSIAGATAARIKHRLSMLVQGANNPNGVVTTGGSASPGSLSAGSSKSTGARRRAPSPMMEEKDPQI
ncbi:Ras GTPase-activating protein 1 [Dinochytrium kinnereticum]|nr:Ras GTPase-activating protein 1 [Dinochytrium kinnereticum]